MSKAISSSTHPDLLTRFGNLLTLEHPGEILGTTFNGLYRVITRQKQPVALALASVRRKLGRLTIR